MRDYLAEAMARIAAADAEAEASDNAFAAGKFGDYLEATLAPIRERLGVGSTPADTGTSSGSRADASSAVPRGAGELPNNSARSPAEGAGQPRGNGQSGGNGVGVEATE